MPAPVKVPLPIFFTQSHDESALPDMVGARLVNGFVDKIGDMPFIRKAPGMETQNDLFLTHAWTAEHGIDGEFWWDDLSMTITVANGRFYKKTTVNGATEDITGDALTVTGVPVIFATNGWALFAASGGRIVTWHLYGSPVTAPGLTLATTKDKLKVSAFTYKILGVTYSKGAEDNISPGSDVIPQNTYGAVALDIDYAGTITAVSATDNATGYASAALAVAGIPACSTSLCRIGWVTVMKSDGAFTFETTEFDAANVTEAYTDNTLYSSETTKFLADADAPTVVTHVGYIDGYILAGEEETERWWYANATNVANWSALSFVSAEGAPDKLVALRVASKEVVCFGKKSIEFYYDDGVSPFSPIMGAFKEKGTIAPYTICNTSPAGEPGVWMFMDDERRIVSLTQRDFTILSGAYDDIIRDIDKVSDAYSSYFTLGRHSFYVINFPSVEMSFALNLTTQTWAEWGDWNAPTYGLWKGRSYCYATDWEMHLIGDNSTGKIYKIRGDYFKQGTDNIRTYVRTGNFSNGNYEEKIEEELILRLKRGVGNQDVEEPVMTYRYRDNGSKTWSNEKTISLGKIGDNTMFVHLMRQGVYRSRQREFVHSDPSDFVFSDMEAKLLTIATPSARGR